MTDIPTHVRQKIVLVLWIKDLRKHSRKFQLWDKSSINGENNRKEMSKIWFVSVGAIVIFDCLSTLLKMLYHKHTASAYTTSTVTSQTIPIIPFASFCPLPKTVMPVATESLIVKMKQQKTSRLQPLQLPQRSPCGPFLSLVAWMVAVTDGSKITTHEVNRPFLCTVLDKHSLPQILPQLRTLLGWLVKLTWRVTTSQNNSITWWT